MTCVDQTMIRRDGWRAGFAAAFVELARRFAPFSWWRHGRVEDLNDHMLRDIGFSDGRVTEAAMRQAAGRRGGMDQF